MDVLDSFATIFPELFNEHAATALPRARKPPGDPGSEEADQHHDSEGGAAGGGPQSHEGEPQDPYYGGKVKAITQRFEGIRSMADELQVYLQQAQEAAKDAEAEALAQADKEFTPAWRNTGLPMKPSHLHLDAAKMQPAKLVNPKAIMTQYMQVKSKEQLHPPHTYEYNDTSIQPNYLNTTSNLQTRRKRVLTDAATERVRASYLAERAWPHLSEDEVAGRIAESEARRREQDLRMPPSQYDAEKKIIASMHHKLNFLRNPRYPLPPAVKLLQSQFQPGPTWGVGGGTSPAASPTELPPGTGTGTGTISGDKQGGSPRALEATTARRRPPIKSNMTAQPDQVFVVEPPEVVFEGYEVGAVYTQTLHVRNVTQVIRNMRLLPPASQYFHLSMPRLPTDTSSIAPGMAAVVLVRFTPDSLADYDDEFAVDTATSRFSVRLRARRPPPRLTMQPEMHIGEVLCGNRKVQQFAFSNQGGHGRFRVIPASYWPERYDAAPADKATVGPFEVWPLYYELAPGDEVVLNVAFEPHSMGLHDEKLVLVCDNCQVKHFCIKGLASDVDVQLETIDGTPLASAAAKAAAAAPAAPSAPAAQPAFPPPALVMRNSGTLHAGPPSPSALPTPRNSVTVPGQLTSLMPRPSIALPTPRQSFASVIAPAMKKRQSTTGLEAVAGVAAGAAAVPELPLPDAVLDSPLWFGEVVPGSTFTRRVAVRNTTSLPFPFKWAWSSQPRTHAEHDLAAHIMLTPPAPAPNAPPISTTTPAPMLLTPHNNALALALQRQEAASLGEGETGRTVTGGGAGAPGQVDLVALGLEEEAPFDISPCEGVLQPGELMDFHITFAPPALSRYLRWAQLQVDKSHPGPATRTPTCNTTVLELALEGVAAPLQYGLNPKAISIPGTLTPGQQVTRSLTLDNHTRAPAAYRFEGGSASVVVTPRRGVVPPMGTAHIGLTFTAGSDAGAAHEALVCHMQHGAPTPLQLDARVEPPRLELLTNRLDFGLVRLNGCETRTLHLRNTSSTCPAEWALQECVLPHRTGGRGSTSRCTSSHAAMRDRERDARGAAGASMTGPTEEQASGPQQSVGSRTGSMLLSMAERAALEDLTYLQFTPCGGVLGPGQEVEVEVVCHGLSDGQHHSIVKLTSPGGPVNCLEAFAAVVTPHAVVSRPKVDMGIVFQGVTARFTFTLRNLALLPLDYSWKAEGRTLEGQQGEPVLPAEMKIRPESGMLLPGEEAEIQVRFTPHITGPITLFGVCDVEGAPLPTGFVVSCTCRGLDVSYDVMTPEQYERWSSSLKDARVRRRRDDVSNFSGMTHLPPEVLVRLGNSRLAQPSPPPDPRHHVAHFGAAVPLGEVRSMYVVVTNRTPIASSLNTWLESFGVDDLNRITGKKKGGKASKRTTYPTSITPAPAGGSSSGSGLQGAGSGATGPPATATTPSRGTRAVLDTAGGMGSSWAAGDGMGTANSTTKGASRHAPIKLDAAKEKLLPFHSQTGNAMMATRRQQQDSASALGDKGLALSVVPPGCALPAWSRMVLVLSAFNDMCGDYFDVLHVKVGDLPEKRIPVRIGVSGTPLVVQKERVLRPGLAERGSTWTTSLGWGQLALGVALDKSFYVFNTGSLDMHLAWTFYRYQDDDDCAKPGAKLFDLQIEPDPVDSQQAGAGLDVLDELRTPGAGRPSLMGWGAPPPPQGQVSRDTDPYQPTLMSFGSLAAGNMAQLMSALNGGSSFIAPQPGGDGAAAGRMSQGSSLVRRDTSLSLSLVLPGEEAEVAAPGVRLTLQRHAEPDTQPFVVEPAEAVIRGGDCARFVVHFDSMKDQQHLGYLHGVQKVLSREGPLSLKVWPTGDQGQAVGAMLSGTFHTYAGQPPAPLKPLRVDLSAITRQSHLEPDANSELSFVCWSTQPPSHTSHNHLVTLANHQACPLIFSLAVEGPFAITGAAPSAPQDPVLYKGTKGLSTGLPPPGQPLQPASWQEGQLYLPPGDSVDVGLQFTPPQGEQREDYNLQGDLVVQYANGDVQRLPLSAHVMHPALELRHPQQLRPATPPPPSPSPTPAPAAAAEGATALSSTGDAPTRAWSAGVASSSSGAAGQQSQQQAALEAAAQGQQGGPGPAPDTLPAADDAAAAAGALAAPTLTRDLSAPLSFGRVHVQRPKELEVSLVNPTLVDALWAVTSVGQPPKYCKPEELPHAGYSEAQIGPFTIQPAQGSLAGRGIKLPRTQRVSITFAPPDSKPYSVRLMFGASKGRPVELLLTGQGSYDETEEHQHELFQI